MTIVSWLGPSANFRPGGTPRFSVSDRTKVEFRKNKPWNCERGEGTEKYYVRARDYYQVSGQRTVVITHESLHEKQEVFAGENVLRKSGIQPMP